MGFALTSACFIRELSQTGLAEYEKVACRDGREQGMDE